MLRGALPLWTPAKACKFPLPRKHVHCTKLGVGCRRVYKANETFVLITDRRQMLGFTDRN